MKGTAALRACAAGLAVLLTGCHPSTPDGGPPTGTLEVDHVRIASRHGGRVVRILVHEGDSVPSGAPLLELEAPELQARWDQIHAQLAELKAGPRPEEIAIARAELQAQTADLQFARTELHRTQALFTKRAVSETDLDRAAARATTLEKTAATAQARLDLLLAGTRRERVALAEAQLAELESQRAELHLTAPSAGSVEVIAVKPGDVLEPGREALTLLLTDHLWVRVYVPQPWLVRIKPGQNVSVGTDAIPGSDFPGVIEQVAREAEFTPRNVQTPADRIAQVFAVKVRLTDPSGTLRAGMSAEVRFHETYP